MVHSAPCNYGSLAMLSWLWLWIVNSQQWCWMWAHEIVVNDNDVNATKNYADQLIIGAPVNLGELNHFMKGYGLDPVDALRATAFEDPRFFCSRIHTCTPEQRTHSHFCPWCINVCPNWGSVGCQGPIVLFPSFLAQKMEVGPAMCTRDIERVSCISFRWKSFRQLLSIEFQTSDEQNHSLEPYGCYLRNRSWFVVNNQPWAIFVANGSSERFTRIVNYY